MYDSLLLWFENLEKINENLVEGIWIKNPDLFMQDGAVSNNSA